MKVLFRLALLSLASVVLSGCGIIGHNVGRLRQSIPQLGQLLKIEYASEELREVRIEGGKVEELAVDE